MLMNKISSYFLSVVGCLLLLILGSIMPKESYGWGYMQCKKECTPAAQKCITKAKADECARECPSNQYQIVDDCRREANARSGEKSDQEVRPHPTPTQPVTTSPQKPTGSTKPSVRSLPRPREVMPETRPEPTKPSVRSLPRPREVVPETRPGPTNTVERPNSEDCSSSTAFKINDMYQQLKSEIDPRGMVATAGLDEKYQKIIPSQIHLNQKDAASLQKLSSFIPLIVAQEKKNCDYIPLYHSGGAFLALLTDTQNFIDRIKRNKGYKGSSDFFGKGKSPRLGKGTFKTVAELKKYIDDNKLGLVKLDHNDLISPHLVSANLSMLDTDPGESAIGYYFRRHNINLNTDRAKNILKGILNNAGIYGDEKIEKYDEILDQYVNSINAVIIQFFVKKEMVKDVVYLSKPFGLFVNGSEAFRNKTREIIENYQHMSAAEYTTYLSSIGHLGSGVANLWRDRKVQVRLLIDSPLLGADNLKYSIYYEPKPNPTSTIRELQQQLYRHLQEDLQGVDPSKQSKAVSGDIFNAEKEANLQH